MNAIDPTTPPPPDPISPATSADRSVPTPIPPASLVERFQAAMGRRADGGTAEPGTGGRTSSRFNAEGPTSGGQPGTAMTAREGVPLRADASGTGAATASAAGPFAAVPAPAAPDAWAAAPADAGAPSPAALPGPAAFRLPVEPHAAQGTGVSGTATTPSAFPKLEPRQTGSGETGATSSPPVAGLAAPIRGAVRPRALDAGFLGFAGTTTADARAGGTGIELPLSPGPAGFRVSAEPPTTAAAGDTATESGRGGPPTPAPDLAPQRTADAAVPGTDGPTTAIATVRTAQTGIDLPLSPGPADFRLSAEPPTTAAAGDTATESGRGGRPTLAPGVAPQWTADAAAPGTDGPTTAIATVRTAQTGIDLPLSPVPAGFRVSAEPSAAPAAGDTGTESGRGGRPTLALGLAPQRTADPVAPGTDGPTTATATAQTGIDLPLSPGPAGFRVSAEPPTTAPTLRGERAEGGHDMGEAARAGLERADGPFLTSLADRRLGEGVPTGTASFVRRGVLPSPALVAPEASATPPSRLEREPSSRSAPSPAMDPQSEAMPPITLGAAMLQSLAQQGSSAAAPIEATADPASMASRIEALRQSVADTVARILVSDPLHDGSREVRLTLSREILPDTEVRLWRQDNRIHVEFIGPSGVLDQTFGASLPRLAEAIQQRQPQLEAPVVTIRGEGELGQPGDGRSRQQYQRGEDEREGEA